MIQQLSTLLPLAFGILLGWFAHVLTSRRDREARAHAEKRDRDAKLTALEVFLLSREQLVEVTRPDDVSGLYYPPSGSLSAGSFRTEAAKVRREFSGADRAEFDRLDEAISRMPPQLLQADTTRTSRDKLADAIRALLQFVRNA